MVTVPIYPIYLSVAATDVVYVGDGLWDVKTSAALAMRFIGVAHESSPEHLRDAGASVCIGSYLDRAGFEAALRVATVPPGRAEATTGRRRQ